MLSPSTAAIDRGKKMQMLARYGVPEYWLVDSRAKTIEMYTLSDAGYLLAQVVSAGTIARAQTLPELSFPTAGIFGDW